MRALSLFSGGLDSLLATRLIQEQGIEVIGVFFRTPFLAIGTENKVKKMAKMVGIPLFVVFLGREYIELIKNPPHGYGENMNPCLDCHAMMAKKAKMLMEKLGAKFLITGEVVGERGSQTRPYMRYIEKYAGLKDLILRPLSAKILPETIPEKEKWVNREKLLGISGRSRKPQFELAQKYGFKDFPTPSGGCLITDPTFCQRLKDAFEHGEDSLERIELLKYGRHFRLKSGAKVVVARNDFESRKIKRLAIYGDYLIQCNKEKAPLTLLIGDENDLEEAIKYCIKYSKMKKGTYTVRQKGKGILYRANFDTEVSESIK